MVKTTGQKKRKGAGGVNLSRSASTLSDGTLSLSSPGNPTLRTRKSTVKRDVTPSLVFNILRSVMPAERAKVLAGYSGGTNPDKLKVDMPEVEEIRNRLRETAGVTLADQVAWYLKAAGSPEGASSDQIGARKRIDVLLGYEAAQKVEVNSRHEIVAAVGVFREFSRETGLNPRQLKMALANRRREVEAVGVEIIPPKQEEMV